MFIFPSLRLLDEDDIEKIMQKNELKKQLSAEIELNKAEFKDFLRNNYALYPLPLKHQMLSNSIKDQFDGQARRALTDHLDDNIREASFLNNYFDVFLKNFK